MKEPTCKERVNAQAESRLEDLRAMWEAEQNGVEPDDEDLGPLNEYGLDFSYQAPDEQTPEGYFCYLLSTGGPHEEFRFYMSFIIIFTLLITVILALTISQTVEKS